MSKKTFLFKIYAQSFTTRLQQLVKKYRLTLLDLVRDNPNLWHGRQGLAPGKQAATDMLVQK